jgi:hypothetical protein
MMSKLQYVEFLISTVASFKGHILHDQIEWTPERLQNDAVFELKEVTSKVRLFKRIPTNGALIG